MRKIFFSIIIPTYNREEIVKTAIQSVKAQTYSEWELIVVDDGGSDKTKEVVEAFSDRRIKYFWKENGERGAARNFGVQKARGDYITFLDSDDKFLSNHLEDALYMIKKHNPEVFHLAYRIEDERGKILEIKRLPNPVNLSLFQGNGLSCSAIFLKRDIALQFPFSQKRVSSSEDWLLWLKLVARFPFYHYFKVSSILVQHGNRTVSNLTEDKLLEGKEHLISELLNDRIFMEKYGKWLYKIEARSYSYLALHMALQKNVIKAIKYLIKGVLLNWEELFFRRTLAIIKHIMIALIFKKE
jgi:glycosyltransferase involved in cell wall biosynthesis